MRIEHTLVLSLTVVLNFIGKCNDVIYIILSAFFKAIPKSEFEDCTFLNVDVRLETKFRRLPALREQILEFGTCTWMCPLQI